MSERKRSLGMGSVFCCFFFLMITAYYGQQLEETEVLRILGHCEPLGLDHRETEDKWM